MLKVNMSFKERVWEIVKKVPRGRVTTYKEIAKALGNKKACRAVALALKMNPKPIEIPCHRVVRSDGSIGGYSLGVDKKIELLKGEGVRIENGKVDLKKYFFSLNDSKS